MTGVQTCALPIFRGLGEGVSGVAGQCCFYLFYGLRFDLADPLGRHAILVGQVLQRARTAFVLVTQPARLHDVAAALVERGQCVGQAFGLQPVALPILDDLGGLAAGGGQVGGRTEARTFLVVTLIEIGRASCRERV